MNLCFVQKLWLPSLVFDWCFLWRVRIPVFTAVFNNARLCCATRWHRPRCERHSSARRFDCLSVIFVEKCLCLHPSYQWASVFLSHWGKRRFFRHANTHGNAMLRFVGTWCEIATWQLSETNDAMLPSFVDDDDDHRRSSSSLNHAFRTPCYCLTLRITSAHAFSSPFDREIVCKCPRNRPEERTSSFPSYLTKKKFRPPQRGRRSFWCGFRRFASI